MAGNQGGKGNPASHRMSNKALKDRRAKSWNRGQKRKQERIDAQKAAAQRNKELRAQGLPTPYEVAQKARRERRADRG